MTIRARFMGEAAADDGTKLDAKLQLILVYIAAVIGQLSKFYRAGVYIIWVKRRARARDM